MGLAQTSHSLSIQSCPMDFSTQLCRVSGCEIHQQAAVGEVCRGQRPRHPGHCNFNCIALRINFHRGLRLPLVHDLVPLKGHCYFSWCAQHLHARSLCTFFHMTFQHYNLTSLDAISEAVCSMSVGLFPCCVTFCMGMAQFQGQMALACIL